jgi:hypothetical protein
LICLTLLADTPDLNLLCKNRLIIPLMIFELTNLWLYRFCKASDQPRVDGICLANIPADFAKSRTCLGLTITTGNPTSTNKLTANAHNHQWTQTLSVRTNSVQFFYQRIDSLLIIGKC